MTSFSFNIVESLQTLGVFIAQLWWLWLFIALFLFAREIWLIYVREYFKATEFKWVLLEVRPPAELQRTPKAMEQIFTSIHNFKNSPSDPKEKWWDGEVTMWYSFELVSFGGELHIFVRTPESRRNMIEASFYAQYPDVEIIDASEDYINRFPPTFDELAEQGYNLFGNELLLANKDMYPLRTYDEFEAVVTEKELDPVAALLEILTGCRPQEHIWIQVLVRPVTDDFETAWKERVDDEVSRLKKQAATGATQDEDGRIVYEPQTPGERETFKVIEEKAAKPPFETLIRYVYMAPKEIFGTNLPQRGVLSAFNQYQTETWNKFRHNYKVWTRANIYYWPHIFPDRRLRLRRHLVYKKYRERYMRSESWLGGVLDRHAVLPGTYRESYVLGAHELATIFHLPTHLVVTGPLMKRVEARRTGPPAGLPIYGSGEKLPGID